MKTKIYPVLALAATLFTAGQCIAQVTISHDGRPERIFQPAKGLNQTDQAFLQDAAIANIFEIEASSLAIQRSSDPFVIEFSKEMIIDHQMLLEELKTLATSKNVELANELPLNLQHELNRLSNQNGANFDAAFQNAQTSGHTALSLQFKSEIENGNDDDVKAYTVKALPMIDMHYRMLLMKETMMGPTKMQHND
jgi:putative membrane protein